MSLTMVFSHVCAFYFILAHSPPQLSSVPHPPLIGPLESFVFSLELGLGSIHFCHSVNMLRTFLGSRLSLSILVSGPHLLIVSTWLFTLDASVYVLLTSAYRGPQSQEANLWYVDFVRFPYPHRYLYLSHGWSVECWVWWYLVVEKQTSSLYLCVSELEEG